MNITYFTGNETEKTSTRVWDIRYLFAGLMFGNTGLGVFYLLMLNGVATQGFDLEKAKQEQVAWQKQIEVVDIELAIPASLYALESNEQVQEMESVGVKRFLSRDGQRLALRIEKP